MRHFAFLFCLFLIRPTAGQNKLQLQADFLKPAVSTVPIGILGQPFANDKQRDIVPRQLNFLNQETVLGTTLYDLQSNAATQNRFIIAPDGRRAAVWIHTLERNQVFSDRGTGYNYYDGTSWEEMPSQRLESIRVGWPSISLLDDGRVHIVSHTGASVIHTLTMDMDGTNVVESDIPDNTPFGLLWPRSAASGQTVHVIGSTTPRSQMGSVYQGIDGNLLYYRSSDGGETWDIIDFSLPGLDTTVYRFITADTYTIEAMDDVVAIVIFASWGDVLLFKSFDRGETWEKTIVNDFPLDGYEIDDGYTTDDIPNDLNAPNPLAIFTCNGSGEAVIDDQGLVHVTFADGYVLDDMSGDSSSSFFPGWSGISYWNETMLSPIFAGGVLDINGNDTLDIIGSAIPRYAGNTITSMPTMAVDNSGGIIIVYSMVSEANFNELDEQHYRHLVAVKSLDNGATWGPPYDMINIDLIDEDFYEFVEAVYPSAHDRYNDTLYLVYQEDFFPGHTFVEADNDPQADNFITQFALPVDLVLDVSALSVDEPSIRNHFEIFPTATETSIAIHVDQDAIVKYDIRIFDLMGSEVLHMPDNVGNQQINLTSLIPTSYFLHVRSPEGTAVFKIIKQ